MATNLMVTVLAGYVDSSLPAEEQVRRIAELRSIVKNIESLRGLDKVNRTMNAPAAAKVAPAAAKVAPAASRAVSDRAHARAGDFYSSGHNSWYHMGENNKSHFGVIGCGKPCRTCGAIAPAAPAAAKVASQPTAPAAPAAAKVASQPTEKRTYGKCTACGKIAKPGFEWFSPKCRDCRKAQG